MEENEDEIVDLYYDLSLELFKRLGDMGDPVTVPIEFMIMQGDITSAMMAAVGGMLEDLLLNKNPGPMSRKYMMKITQKVMDNPKIFVPKRNKRPS